ncbi:radical SAM protein (plasmid) [Paraclostridium sordellii]|uniref:radical SAM/SPASM domain-containing protein n=1 Tax=Paraclostridium sordellii TaxID=1505 RepID=UPI0005E49EBE|nr:radical SAM protein [Paeniclostridium sordellii]CEP41219.1 radical SAM domain-containing protein [[Clostridium] sordellii] [Paeniclostridium sordellii]
MKFTIFITEKCNLRCKYCYESGLDRSKDMDINVANKTIDFILRKIKSESLDIPLYIVLHGGEPLVNFEMVKYIHKKLSDKVKGREIIYDMTTNGTVLDSEKIDFICNNIDNISVSIDGTRASHDKNRVFVNGEGSYDLVIKNVKKLLDREKDVRIRMTYTTNTVSELYDSISQIAKYGFTTIVPVADYMDTNWTQNHMNTLNDQISMLINLKENYPSLDIGLLDIEGLNKRKGDCFGGILSFTIDVNGDIFPCTFSVGDEELKLGSVFDEDVSDAKQKELVKIYTSENEGCKSCLRKECCDSIRCKLLNKKVMGDPNKSIPIMCALEKVCLTTTRKLKACNVD